MGASWSLGGRLRAIQGDPESLLGRSRGPLGRSRGPLGGLLGGPGDLLERSGGPPGGSRGRLKGSWSGLRQDHQFTINKGEAPGFRPPVLKPILDPYWEGLGGHVGLIFGSFSGVLFGAVFEPETGVFSEALGPQSGG